MTNRPIRGRAPNETMRSAAASLLQMAERRYDERDVAAILREAAENQASRMESGEMGAGMTLAEIQRLAKEVGIDADQVAAAAARRESRHEKAEVSRFWGGSAQLIRTRTSDGELDDSAWEEIVAELRAALGEPGTIGKMGASNEWTGGNGFLSVHFSAKPQDGTTRFRITLDQSALFVRWLFTFAGIVLGSAVAGAMMSKAGVWPLAIWGILLALASLVCFATNRAIARWQARNIGLANSLLNRAEELVPERTPEVPDAVRENLANPPHVSDGPDQSIGRVTL